ncbi:F-BAR domain only protein 2 isoform X3 [Manacus vitellinus]|uniref:F-BAR domain only protein 2 isoform X3 n=1 Tax=Manacus vitellinus TaxID=328815 RepID=UPI00115C9A2B|nr:F-BAR domain only protein 2 isoform X3 [Manacus vitellinus]XP_051644337.1 F-BAR domain only protein 2 isoform X1 [Manacus candei]
MAYFVENFWGERNNGFDVLYHNMKHGHLSTKDLADFIRERATIEETYSRSMTKLAKSASNYTQLGTFAPVWDVFKTSTEKLASCHLDLVRRLQELIKEVHKYGDEQIKAYKKTKEDVSGTLEAVQNIQSITQALQKSKENYNTKCVEQDRLKKEGATQREIDKAAVKTKKATDTYKLYVEKYAVFKADFEVKMTETAQKFQDIEETHLLRMKEIIESLSNTIKEIHIQIGEVHEEFINNMTNTTVESLIQKFAESKGTGKERPGPIEFEECNTSSVVEGIKPRKRKPFGLSGIMKKEKDTESVECPDADSVNFPDVDDEGYSIKPEATQDTKENHFYSSSDSDSEDDEPRRFHVEIKPVQPNNSSQYTMPSLDELKVSIGNITLSPAISAQMNQNSSSEELTKSKLSAPSNEKGNSDLLAWDPLFSSSLESSSSVSLASSSSSATLKEHSRSSSSSTTDLAGCRVSQSLLGHQTDSGSTSPSSPDFTISTLCKSSVTAAPSGSTSTLSCVSRSQSEWISFADELLTIRHTSTDEKEPQRLHFKTENACLASSAWLGNSANSCASEDQRDLFSNTICHEQLFIEETGTAAEISSASSSTLLDYSLVSSCARTNKARPTTPLSVGTIVPPPRPASRPKLTTGKLSGINEIPRPFSPPLTSNSSPPPAAPLARAESISSISSSASLSAANTPTVGVSRGPSPVSLGNQDTLPVAVALTESVNAYFKGADPTKCIVKITGDMTISFPSGIIKVFTSNPSPAVLCFRVKNTSKLEQILPNAQLVYSDQSQSDSSTKDFWMNMQAITVYLKKLSEQNPSASYYNVDVLKYQVSSNGIQSTPLNLATYWKCDASTTDVRVDYKYNPESMNVPGMLSNVQVVVPVDGGVINMQSLPPAKWNADQMKAYWKISSISEKSENGGSGSLRAKFELSGGPSKPATLAVQFISEGSTLSGVDVELVGTGYRLSLLKKRFATGRYMADC